MTRLFLLALLGIISAASARKYCCLPDKFSSKLLITNIGDNQQTLGKAYTDFIRGSTVTFLLQGTYTVATYIDHKTGEIYTVIDNKCTKGKSAPNLTKKNCIPDNITLADNLNIGGPHEDIEMYHFYHKQDNVRVEMEITKQHCYPVQATTIVANPTKSGTEILFSNRITYHGLKLGIDDPSVFDVPEICKNSQTEPNHFQSFSQNSLMPTTIFGNILER